MSIDQGHSNDSLGGQKATAGLGRGARAAFGGFDRAFYKPDAKRPRRRYAAALALGQHMVWVTYWPPRPFAGILQHSGRTLRRIADNVQLDAYGTRRHMPRRPRRKRGRCPA